MSEAIENLSIILLALRKKLVLIITAFFICVFFSFQFTSPIIERMKEDLLPEGAKLVYVSPLEVVMLKLKISFILGLLAVLPLIVFYIYRAISCRFTFKPRIIIRRSQFILLLFAALAMFVLGVFYAYFLMLPLFLKYLFLSAASSGLTATYSVFKFISFAGAVTALFGLIFELPLVLTFLTKNGFLKYGTLVAYRKHIYILFLIAGAIITPPDVLSQVMVAIPMAIFFEISLVIVRLLGVTKKHSDSN